MRQYLLQCKQITRMYESICNNLNWYHIRGNSIDVWLLGITIVLGGQYFHWNTGLEAGFGSFFIAFCIMGAAYLSFVFVLADLVSLLPFRGGAFVITRSLLGFYSGFIVGCFEVLQYILYVSSSALLLSDIIGQIFNTSEEFKPLYCFLFYWSAIIIYIHRTAFWPISSLIGITTLLILLIYCFGNLRNTNFIKYAAFAHEEQSEKWFHGGLMNFASVFPLSAWPFLGVESLGLTCERSKDASSTVPRGMILTMWTILISGIFVIFVVSSSPPGIMNTFKTKAPLSYGFQSIFNISEAVALGLMIPALYGTAFGFIFGYKKIIQYMAASQLLPKVLSITNKKGSAFASLIAGSVVSEMICIVAYFYPHIRGHIFNICILSGFITYIAQCICQFTVKTRLPNEVSKFPNPLGAAGVIYAIVVFICGIICTIGFRNDNGTSALVLVIFTAIVSVYYWAYASKRQIISEEEVKYTFTYLVMKRNARVHVEVQHKKSRKSRRNSTNLANDGRLLLSSVVSSVKNSVSKKAESIASSFKGSANKEESYIARSFHSTMSLAKRTSVKIAPIAISTKEKSDSSRNWNPPV